MGILDRLGSVINSYFNDFEKETAGRFGKSSYGDPDLNSAYEELDDYLNNGKERTANSRKDAARDNVRSGYSADAKLPPKELMPDFKVLEVLFGADLETCKASYKNLLKTHHPDRHAGHEGNYKKATEISAKINAAWDRIEKYYLSEGK